MGIRERIFGRREPAFSPQELLNASFNCFQEGSEKIGTFFSRRWHVSIQAFNEDGNPRIVIRKSRNQLTQNSGELAVIVPSPGSLSYYKIINGTIKEKHINSPGAERKIKDLLNEVAT